MVLLKFWAAYSSICLTISSLAGPGIAAPPLVQGRTGLVTSTHPDATRVGLEILKQGGNAVDAAVATAMAISVAEPFSAGIGGGGFLLLRLEETDQMIALDFRERAPLKADSRLYLDAEGQVIPRASIDGHRAVAVPGTIAGLQAIHQKHGRLPWQTLLNPAIKLAEEGFVVSDRTHRIIRLRQKALAANPAAREIFLTKGQPLTVGSRLIQTDLAKTLKRLAQDPQDFYSGSIALAIAKDMRNNDGLVSLWDLRTYAPTWREPLCGEFQQMQVCSMPPPSSGGVHLNQILNLLTLGLPFPAKSDHPDYVHALVEAMKIAYADRAEYLGDADFVEVPVQELISPQYAQRRFQEIDPNQARPADQVKAMDARTLKWLQKESNDTSHLNVVDRDRNAVSLTFTLNLGFGAGVVVPGTGILLNNEMDDFATAPGIPNAFGLVGNTQNAIAPAKKPLSSMTPTIVTEAGKLRLVVGAAGGSTIITTVLQLVMNVLVFEQDVATAINAPKVHHQWRPLPLRIEERVKFPPTTVEALKQRGHDIQMRTQWGNANLIEVTPQDKLFGAADPRGEGTASGY
ncbi:gamma-glutamyltransferase [Acaryochloris marina]|uniref:Glutathione hydrolase proenzyme n=1 Tax=Acaryochloris marina (strain MBIC 11017) TaxID=329726 RepID=B0C3Q0_ACAM1|nr:gamma-glutamyltransferase [Acaryochloris marina]ABW30987.1 gamma-glutamyltransferase [Acaryochloris marina MBIC11017]BDM79710.1 gamma-glutamyltransferase [Acaryochloris marina MBIC10699]